MEITTNEFVETIIYDEHGNFKNPSPLNNLYWEIQTLVFLYQNNPEWSDELKQDVMEYVQKCTDLLEKI